MSGKAEELKGKNTRGWEDEKRRVQDYPSKIKRKKKEESEGKWVKSQGKVK